MSRNKVYFSGKRREKPEKFTLAGFSEGQLFDLGSRVLRVGEIVEGPPEAFGLPASLEPLPPSKPLYISKIDYDTKIVTLSDEPPQ